MVAVALGSAAAFPCTSAIISASNNPSGRPVLWKHRDTSNTDNKVEYVPAKDENYGYVALFNASDKNLEEAWIGMNEVGFAVMNTHSYNIKNDNISLKMMDKEGILMSKALQTCKSVEDFQLLLDNYPKPMGVEANFGVIDAFGNGAFFETNNYSYVRFDLADEPDGVIIRTNYSHSVSRKKDCGAVREAAAKILLRPYIERHSVTPELLTEVVSRTFFDSSSGMSFNDSGAECVLDKNFIPRFNSTATVAIEGCIPLAPDSAIIQDFIVDQYIMWTGLGYPPVAEIRAVRCREDGVDEGLRGILPDGHSPLADEAKRKRDLIFLNNKKGENRQFDLSKLYNVDGTGFAQQIVTINRSTYRSINRTVEMKGER